MHVVYLDRPKRRNIPAWGSFLLAALTYAGVEANKLAAGWLYVAFAALLFGSLWWIVPKLRQRRRAQTNMATLRVEWPKFRALVREFSDFFEQGSARSMYYVLERVNVTPQEKNSLSWYIAAMTAFTFSIVRIAQEIEPRSLSEALAVVRGFESLKDAFFNSAALSRIRELEPNQNWKDTRDVILGDFEHFKRQYRGFARDANEALDEYIFAGPARKK